MLADNRGARLFTAAVVAEGLELTEHLQPESLCFRVLEETPFLTAATQRVDQGLLQGAGAPGPQEAQEQSHPAREPMDP